MNKKLFAVLLSLACIIAVWSLYQVERSRDRVEALTATVQDMERDATHRSRQPGAANPMFGSGAHVAAVARSAARGEALAALAEQRAEQSDGATADPQRPPPVTYQESRDRVVAAFDDESTDPDWSAEATGQLDDVVRGNLPEGSRLDALACHSTMCRVEVAHADAEVHGAFIMDGMRDWPGSIFVAEERQDDDEYRVTLYVARSGSRLPLAPR